MAALTEIVTTLEHLAPPKLAGSWDNTGLLVEGTRTVKRVLLTIDLLPSVLEEAVEHDVDMVIAYHPTIFRGLKSITQRSPYGPQLLELIRRGVHLYSPHSALDAVEGGMNDWLLEAFGPLTEVAPIEPDAANPRAGAGRLARKITPEPVGALVNRIKQMLGLRHLRLSGDLTQPISTVAVCPGSGGSVFAKLRSVDLLLTGEMGHHDVLAWAMRGTAVVLTEHTNTERGYLPRLAERLRSSAGVEVFIAATDADPLRIV